MSINITATGFLGTDPVFYNAKSEEGSDFTSFRMANTNRFYSKKTESWQDGSTTWFTVKAFNGLAKGIYKSLKISDSVVVSGTLVSEEWENDEGQKMSALVINAKQVGHDISREKNDIAGSSESKKESKLVKSSK